jgi:hypothetical protein
VYHTCIYFLGKPCPVIIYHSGWHWDGTDKIPVELALLYSNPFQNRGAEPLPIPPCHTVNCQEHVPRLNRRHPPPHLCSRITSPLNIHNYPSTPCEIPCLMFNYRGYKLHETDCDCVSIRPVPCAVTTKSDHNKSWFSLYHERLDSALRACVISLSVPPRLMKPSVCSFCLRI